MYVERHGSGPQLFLGLHGWSGDHTTFDPLLPYLPPAASLFAVDLPGCGKSPAPPEWRLETVAGEIADTIRRLAAPSLTLVGNCSGGLLGLCAVRLLAEAGEGAAVERLVLIDPFAYWPWYFKVFASPAIGRYAYAATFANPLGRRIVNAALAKKRRGETDLTEGFDAVDPSVTLAHLRILREIGAPEQFAAIRVPVHIVHGERTFAAVRRSAGIFRSIWPDAEVTELRGAGHVPLREAPAPAAAIIFGGKACRET